MRLCSSIGIASLCLLQLASLPLVAQETGRTATSPKNNLGAATWLPKETGFFWARFGMAQELKDIQESQAFQRFWRLPVVQMGLTQLRSSPQYQSFVANINAPVFKPITDVAVDALSHEVFFHAGPDAIQFSLGLGRILSTVLNADLNETPQSEWTALALVSALENRKLLDAPPLILGFRLSQPERARLLLEEFAGNAPIPLAREEFENGKGVQWFLEGKLSEILPRYSNRAMERSLQREGLDDSEAQEFAEFFGNYRICIGAGIRHGYLVVSLGDSIAGMMGLGKGPSLHQNALFAKVSAKAKGPLISHSFLQALPVETEHTEAVGQFLTLNLEQLVQGITGRLSARNKVQIQRDVKRIMSQALDFVSKPKESASVVFRNRGVESYSYGPAPSIPTDASTKLSLLSKTGKRAIVVAASREGNAVEAYEPLSQIASLFWKYLDQADPLGSYGDVKELRLFVDVFSSFASKIHQALSDDILPTLDGQQSLFTMDDLGRIDPKTTGFTRELHYPRPAVILQVKDSEKFIKGMGLIGEAFDSLIRDSAKAGLPTPPFFQLPRPAESKVKSHKLYQYAGIPFVTPHVRVLENHVVFGLDLEQTAGMIASKSKLPTTPVDFGAPSGQIFSLRLDRIIELFLHDAVVLLETAGANDVIDKNVLGLVFLHIPELKAIMGSLKRYRQRTYEDDGYTVNHAWVHFEDLPAQ